MNPLTAKQSERIIQRLGERSVTSACPRCANKQWNLEQHLVKMPILDTSGNVMLPEPSIPACVVVCVRCGYVSLHALGALGLIDIIQEAPNREDGQQG